MGERESWNTSVTELVRTFRDAIRRLVPALNRARIAWRKPRAYDDWDEISQTLFRRIVVSSIEWSFNPQRELVVPKYGQPYVDYRSMSFFELLDGQARTSTHFLFRSFDTRSHPFDTVEGVLVDDAGNVMSATPESLTTEEIALRFQYRGSDGVLCPISDLAVLL